MTDNIIIGQSGGPTAVINASLAGIYSAALKNGKGGVFGMLNGVQGLLESRYIDLKPHIKSDLDIELLKRTPASFLGSCRYKLPDAAHAPEIYERIFAVLNELHIRYFIYIGGNDSMDTVCKLSDYAKINGLQINFIGVPKTVDNDLPITDHTPGYGSAAKFVATVTKEIIRDTENYDIKNVTVIETMGRHAGWLAAAAALAKGWDCEGADMILLPETDFCKELFLDRVSELIKKKKRVTIVASEGIKTADGRYICDVAGAAAASDAFGHKALGGAAAVLSYAVSRAFGAKTRAVELSVLQRSASHCAAGVDIGEAFRAGECAVNAAFEGSSGKVVIFDRVCDNPYSIDYRLTDVQNMANLEKKVPFEWISGDGTYVSDDSIDYIRPLIQGDSDQAGQVMEAGLPRHLILKG
ncbi:MAG: diphosphate--fructose-6-phosphate 1-phosphotransferase [Firmicutes bacterium]|nr:diphosphate--fructose-6-phosphate 1-phosphotransferase [Bacillota bacterium]